MNRRGDVAAVVGLFVANLLIISPYLATELSDQPWTTEYNFSALIRLFRTQSWEWNPLWYSGFPLNYSYPPLFFWVGAALPVRSPGSAYHVVSGIGYALVPVAIYVLGVVILQRRSLVMSAALAYSIVPSLTYVIPALKGPASKFSFAPWHFVTLMEYGEGPHHFALALVLLAVAAAWKERWLLAAFLSASVMLTNWPGTTAEDVR